MKNLLILCLFCCFKLKDENEKELSEHPLPLPYYVEDFEDFNFEFIIWTIQLIIAIVAIIVPLPKSKRIQRLITIGLGMLLSSNHILGTFSIHKIITWFSSYLIAFLTVFIALKTKSDRLFLSFIGSYLSVYFFMAIFGASNIFMFFVYMLLSFVIIFVFSIFADNLQYVFVKTMLCTLSICIIIDVCTFINVITNIHGESWNITAGIQNKLGKIIIIALLIVFSVFNLVREFYFD
ncbi:hypothetical protein GVAV_002404 [Gurleya vavrai]